MNHKFERLQVIANRYDKIKKYVKLQYFADYCNCSQGCIRNALYSGFTISDEKLSLLEKAIEKAERIIAD